MVNPMTQHQQDAIPSLGRSLFQHILKNGSWKDHLGNWRLYAAAAGASMATHAAAYPPRCSSPPLGDDVFVVSGLPRSGTSMLMQMLDAGGMPILSDRVREADEDNPKGYFEYESVKKMFRDRDWLSAARGKALKVVAPLVCSLPAGFHYRVLLIERDLHEILSSQAKMISRRGESVEDSFDRRERLRGEYARLIARTKKLLGERADVQLLVLGHEEFLRDPNGTAHQINQFAGGGLDTGRMASAVDRSLHRNRR